MKELIPVEIIERKIYLLLGHKVMIDRDLADLYDVETRVLNQAVRRNVDRFPEDFMFSLGREEIMRISQIVTSNSEEDRIPFFPCLSPLAKTKDEGNGHKDKRGIHKCDLVFRHRQRGAAQAQTAQDESDLSAERENDGGQDREQVDGFFFHISNIFLT